MPRLALLSTLSLAELARMVHHRARDLKKLRKKRRQYQRELGRLDSAIAKIAGSSHSSEANGVARRPRNAVSLAVSIENVLSRASSPVPVAEIVTKVEASGYRSGSANFRNLVNMTLVKDDRFQSAGRGIYVLNQKRKGKSAERQKGSGSRAEDGSKAARE